jgi:hypothetical protein
VQRVGPGFPGQRQLLDDLFGQYSHIRVDLHQRELLQECGRGDATRSVGRRPVGASSPGTAGVSRAPGASHCDLLLAEVLTGCLKGVVAVRDREG